MLNCWRGGWGMEIPLLRCACNGMVEFVINVKGDEGRQSRPSSPIFPLVTRTIPPAARLAESTPAYGIRRRGRRDDACTVSTIAMLFAAIMVVRPLRFQPFRRNIHFGKREQFLAQIFQGSTDVIDRFINDEESVVEAGAFHHLYPRILAVEFLYI